MKNPNDCIAEVFDQNLDAMKKARITSLTDMIELETMTRTLLQYEAIRIERKLGAGHPRTESLNARLITNLELISTLNVEREIYAVKVPEVPEDSALIHGRVVDKNQRGIRGLSVCLVNEQSSPVSDAVDSVTGNSGYYAVSLNADSVEQIRKVNPNGVFLAVLTQRGDVLHRERKPLVLKKGARTLVEISFDRRTCIQVEDPGELPGEDEPDAETVAVPDLVGLPQAKALESLKAAQLNVGELKTESAPDQAGRVLSQDPAGGTRVDTGTNVDLVIAVAENAKVPEVIGIKLGSAKRKIKKYRFAVGKVSYRASQDIGVVLAQEPNEGMEALIGLSIDLVVGKKAGDG